MKRNQIKLMILKSINLNQLYQIKIHKKFYTFNNNVIIHILEKQKAAKIEKFILKISRKISQIIRKDKFMFLQIDKMSAFINFRYIQKLKVTIQKLDPYLNVDPGTMNPYQHGEVFVLTCG